MNHEYCEKELACQPQAAHYVINEKKGKSTPDHFAKKNRLKCIFMSAIRSEPFSFLQKYGKDILVVTKKTFWIIIFHFDCSLVHFQHRM